MKRIYCCLPQKNETKEILSTFVYLNLRHFTEFLKINLKIWCCGSCHSKAKKAYSETSFLEYCRVLLYKHWAFSTICTNFDVSSAIFSFHIKQHVPKSAYCKRYKNTSTTKAYTFRTSHLWRQGPCAEYLYKQFVHIEHTVYYQHLHCLKRVFSMNITNDSRNSNLVCTNFWPLY